MKLSLFGIIGAVGMTAAVALAAGSGDKGAKAGNGDKDMPGSIIGSEFGKTQMELTAELLKQKKHIQSLDEDRTKAFAASKQLAQAEENAIKSLKEFQKLLATRYVDDNGEFQPGLEVAAKDAENINKVFEGYLRAIPLQGRVSAGQAVRTIAWGIERLGQLESDHNSPSEENNSDFEIIAKQRHDAETEIAKIEAKASKLNMKLDPDALRVPAGK